jgi:cytochrome c
MNSLKEMVLPVAFVAFVIARGGDAFAHPDASALVDAQHCMFCHTSEAPHLALSFRQIAVLYGKVPGATSMLAQKASLEGTAHWGDITMPVSDRVDPLSPQDAQTVAQWLLIQ